MNDLYDNIYNSRLKRDDKKFKLWRYVGLMLTYKCSAACRFCYYNCCPEQSGLMSVETAINAWQQLKELAGEDAKIHITGGEPFLYFDRLVEILAEGQRRQLGAVDQIETNAGWVVSSNDTKEKIQTLNSNGMNILKISCDPFHLEYIDIEKIRLLTAKAKEILGAERVLVRWQEYLDNPQDVKAMPERQRLEVFRESYRKYPFRFTGRAAWTLGWNMAETSLEDIKKSNCGDGFLNAKGVHIDPYGNVFSGVCSGIVFGNVNEVPINQIWREIDWSKMNFLGKLFADGPAGLLDEAIKAGLKPMEFYADKCHLCTHLRQFFFDIGRYKKIIEPKECYTNGLMQGELSK